MPIPRLHIDNAVLLVIDVQEKLVPSIVDRDRVIGNCAILLRMAAEMGIPYLVTEHYPKGLGRTVPQITNAMVDASARIEKTKFSAVIDLVHEQFMRWQRSSVIICGIEAHVCVLQSVLDLQSNGRQCFLVSDAISTSQPDQRDHAFRRMESAGAVTTGVLSVMYELLGNARHPAFRPCLELARQIRL